MKLGIARWGLLAMVAGSLAGCLGGGGGDGGTTATTPPPSTGTTTPTTVALPANPPGTSVINVANLSAAEFANTQFTGTITGVTIASPPTVTFQVRDAAGNRIAGLGYTSKSSTATLAGLTNMSFAIAKLVPGTNGSPSKWVSYIVTTVPTICATAAGCTNPKGGTNIANGAIVPAGPAKPSTDNTGTLVDNGDGTYKYTFYRDITGGAGSVQDIVAKNGDVTTGTPKLIADLGDISYQPTLTHRVGIHISGSARGTGSNTADAVQAVPAVGLKTPANLFFDFVPATGAVVSQDETDGAKQRNVVNVANCFTCHVKFTFHGGNALSGVGGARQDTKMCVLCHTDQRKFGVANATITGTTIASGDRMRDYSMKNMPVWIHKIHMGEELVLQGYNASNVLMNEIRFPQDVRNCTKCHSNAPQADQWKTVPSRLACGACHDGIDFATGTGTSVKGATTGHIGGAKSDDSQCALCHSAASVATYHVPVTKPDPANVFLGGTGTNTNAGYIAAYSNNLPAGAKRITWDLSSVTLNSSRQPVFKFRFMDSTTSPATPVVFNTPPATAPASAASEVELMPNFVGGPSVYLVGAMPQDGIAKPADFNISASGYIRAIFNKTATGTGAGTFAGPDSNGYYTITLTGVTIPTSATMLTGGIGYTYSITATLPLTQTNVSGYPYTQNASTVNSGRFGTGGLSVPAPNVTALVSGTLPTGFAAQTARRQAVESSRCNNCHNHLGVFAKSQFHAGQRNDPNSCSFCHNPNRTSSGWSASSGHYVHAIHGAAKRTVNFTWHGTTDASNNVTDGFYNIGYPGVLRECRQCHLPNTVNFGTSTATNNSSAKYAVENANMTYATVATGNITAGGVVSPYVATGSYGSGYSANLTTGATTEAAGTTLVNSPILNICVGCHTTGTALSHMKANGGVFYTARSAVGTDASGKLVNNEQCIVCHGAGKVADAEVVHRQTVTSAP